MPPSRTAPTFYLSKKAPPEITLLLAQTDLGMEIFRPLTFNEDIATISQLPRSRKILVERYDGSTPKSEKASQRDGESSILTKSLIMIICPAIQRVINAATTPSTTAVAAASESEIIPKSVATFARSADDPNLNNEGEEELSTEEEDDAKDADDESGLILKPRGEVGRPGRGGYNLEEKLAGYGWTEAEIGKFKASSPSRIHIPKIS